ncbi:MAG: hypothetical protein ABI621_00005, partial [Chloroflexota bacterium]
PATGFEDQEAHRDLTTPTCKDNRRSEALQATCQTEIPISVTQRRDAQQPPSHMLLRYFP